MKKIFVAVLICSIATLGLIGCGKKAAGTGRPSGQEHPASGQTEHPK